MFGHGFAAAPLPQSIDAAEAPRHGVADRPGSGPDTLPDFAQILDEKGQRLRVTPLKGLERPWALAFLPDGAMLVTERPGRLRRVNADFTLDPEPLAGIPTVLASAYKGLMDVALHPEYADNRWVYLTYSKRLPAKPMPTGTSCTVRREPPRWRAAGMTVGIGFATQKICSSPMPQAVA